jgi:putative membrane protein
MYLWLKAFHLLAVIAWMAGLLYLPRLMVYHAMAEPWSDAAATFKIMDRRLLRNNYIRRECPVLDLVPEITTL